MQTSQGEFFVQTCQGELLCKPGQSESVGNSQGVPLCKPVCVSQCPNLSI